MSEQSLRNPMELHLSYIKFLQTVGLYKYLPESTKWSLFAIGQGLEVVQQVVETTTLGKQQQQSPLPTITTKTIGHFFSWKKIVACFFLFARDQNHTTDDLKDTMHPGPLPKMTY
jgi:hypothetical protein